MLDLTRAPHHDGSELYVSTQAPSLGETVRLRLRAPRQLGLDRVWVRSTPDAEPHYAEGVEIESDEHTLWYEATIVAANPITHYRWLLSGPEGAYRWLTGEGMVDHDVSDASDFTLSSHAAAPDWAADALVYQVFPDRFARSDAASGRPTPAWAVPADWDDTVIHDTPVVSKQFFGGDLDGIIEHLDHIVDLGFNTIYLTPFFEAPSNHRYDATNFDHVDPLLGGDDALVRLTTAAHARGLRVIGDLTTNHSGATHDWFRAASDSSDAPERAFYYFNDDGSYLGWYNVKTLPKFRFGPELIGRLAEGPASVTARWLAEPFNLDGWRIDVANMTGRHNADDHNLDVARAMRATMDAVRPDALLVAEHCHDASRDLTGEGWHGAMNYAGFLRPVWSWLRSPTYHREFLGLPVEVPRLGGESVFRAIRAFQAVTPWRSVSASWSLICSHDTPRIRTVVDDADVVAVAAGLLFTFPGTPMVFAGDELGGVGVKGEDARRPMPWSHPERWDHETHARYRELATLRAASHALRRGSLRWLVVGSEALVYLRETHDEALLCLASRGTSEPITVPAHALGVRAGQHLACVHGGVNALQVAADATVALPAEGPRFQIWKIR